jgi:hypothetical protein
MQEVLKDLEERNIKTEKDKLQEGIATCAEQSTL